MPKVLALDANNNAVEIEISAGVTVYPKKSVHTTSGTFTLPATALPDVTILAVGGGSSGGNVNTGNSGGSTTVLDAAGTTLITAQGATKDKPGRGGGTGAVQVSGTAAPAGSVGMRGRLGYGNGGGTGYYRGAGSGIAGADATAGTGDGGGGYSTTNTASAAGNGGGVELERMSLVPGATYTHIIGAGGTAATMSVGSGASGRVEYHYLDTVP